MSAKEYVEAILGNVDRWYADEITEEAFHARQIELWKAIQADHRVEESVLKILRGEA